MTFAGRNATEGMHRAEQSSGAAPVAKFAPKPYKGPELHHVIDIDALLEILGPAQANYGGGGLGP